ncbi:Box C/D snoRNA protein 1 [Mortierella sp. NVP85]|nr:Box C/D snoRNA protein 1 [Mortierella sp. NVP85]
MDFFATAFVTRDVVVGPENNDNDDVVIKDGILIRDKAITSALDTVKCEICDLVVAKYKCPGCFCQTCSLRCSKQHKQDTTCTGVRSRTHFIDRKRYNEQNMMSDYNFLEEMGRTVDNAARENLKLDPRLHQKRKRDNGTRDKNKNNQEEVQHVSVMELSVKAAQDLERQVPGNSETYRDKQLLMHVRKRGAQLIRMAAGSNKILWTVEWLFPEMETPRRILEHKNEDSNTLINIFTRILTDESNKDLAEKYPQDVRDQCRFYFVIPLRHATQPALYPLRNKDSLLEALKFKKVLEYPTILVVGPSPTNNAPISTGSEQTYPQAAETTGQSTSEVQNDPSTSTSPGSTDSCIVTQEFTHPVLKKYKIEAPPSRWPKRADRPQQDDNSNNGSRRATDDEDSQDFDDEVEPAAKKPRTNRGDKQDDKEDESDSSDSSSDDSSSDSDDSDDSDDDSSSDDDSDASSSSDSSEEEEDKAQMADQPNLEIGLAVLEAFSKDFGQQE